MPDLQPPLNIGEELVSTNAANAVAIGRENTLGHTTYLYLI